MEIYSELIHMTQYVLFIRTIVYGIILVEKKRKFHKHENQYKY